MLETLLKKLQALSRQAVPFDPGVFNDPVAVQTEWSPAKGGGANFRTHKLVTLHADRLEFQAALGAKLFCGFFALVGIIMPSGFLSAMLLSPEFAADIGVIVIVPVLMGLTFLAVGAGLFYFGTAPIVFDRYRGYFWKGRKAPNEVLNIGVLKEACKLDDIHAVQIISELCSGKSSYYSYEMNLVLHDGRRYNVVDHGDQTKIRADAQALAAFLNVPVWDAT